MSSFPQDVETFAAKFPHNPLDLSSIRIVRRGTTEKCTDFNVSRRKVSKALRWLQKNNIFCKDVSINREVSDMLPTDGDVADKL